MPDRQSSFPGLLEGARRPIRRLLQWLLLVVLLPLSLLLIFIGYRGYQRALSQAESSTLTLAQITSDHVEGVVHQAQVLLDTLAQRPAIRHHRPGAPCDPIFREALSINPLFANFNLVNLQGDVVCSSIPLPVGKTVSVKDTPWFPRMLREQRFLISEPFVGRVSRRQVAMLAFPVRDESGQMTGSIQLPLDLQKFKLLGTDKISASTVLTVLDRSGTVVARSSHPEQFVGRNILGSSEIARYVVQAQHGVKLARSSEGIERIYGFVPIPGTPWFATAGVNSDAVLGAVRLESLQISAIGLAVMGLVLWGAFYLQRQIVRPISELEQVAGQVAAGDWSVRAAASGPAEIHAVATQFNLMLDALNRQVQQLAMSEAEMRGLFMGSLHGIMRVQEDGHVQSVNPSACQLFNRSADNLQGACVTELWQAAEPDWFERLLSGQEGHIKLQALASDGTQVPCEV
ncbi:MAG TPA: cache domain-containing protein, partial [Aquabacterium sp.]|nr:cache domain-containing protein [Aquabacterium sp.]